MRRRPDVSKLVALCTDILCQPIVTPAPHIGPPRSWSFWCPRCWAGYPDPEDWFSYEGKLRLLFPYRPFTITAEGEMTCSACLPDASEPNRRKLSFALSLLKGP